MIHEKMKHGVLRQSVKCILEGLSHMLIVDLGRTVFLQGYSSNMQGVLFIGLKEWLFNLRIKSS